jgi:hypothetical protein
MSPPITIGGGQPSMLGWLTAAHAPPWEPAHERVPPKVQLFDPGVLKPDDAVGVDL